MKAFIDTSINWFVIRTNIKSEEKAFTNLLRAGFRDIYLPRKVSDAINPRTHTRRRKAAPLMPRYLFLGLRHSDFGLARDCEGVEYILSEEGRHGKPINIPGQTIEEIFLAERDLRFDETKEAREYHGEKMDNEFPLGSKIHVKVDHLLAGFNGYVLSTNPRRNKVLVDMAIGKIEFSPEDIEAA